MKKDKKKDVRPLFYEKHPSEASKNTSKAQQNHNPNQIIDRNYILNMIINMAPIHFSKLRRISNIGSGTLHEILRVFEFARLIKMNDRYDEDGRAFKIITIPTDQKIPMIRTGLEVEEFEQHTKRIRVEDGN